MERREGMGDGVSLPRRARVSLYVLAIGTKRLLSRGTVHHLAADHRHRQGDVLDRVRVDRQWVVR